MIRLIRDRCIPLTRNKLAPPGSPESADFWRLAYDRLGPAGQDVVDYFLCTPGGRPIPVKDRNLKRALAAWKALPAGERRPVTPPRIDRRSEAPEAELLRPPPGGLILKVSQRVLERNARGGLCLPGKTMISDAGIRVPAHPNGDFLWLTEAEWRSLVPVSPRPGQTVAVPDAVRERIFRFHLGNGAKRLTRPWTREELRSGTLKLTVEEASEDLVRLRLDGSALLMSSPDEARAERGYAPRLVGLLEYEPGPGRFRRFDFVALGDCWGVETEALKAELRGPYRYPLGVAFELSEGRDPGDRLPPFWLWSGKFTRSYRQEYLGK